MFLVIKQLVTEFERLWEEECSTDQEKPSTSAASESPPDELEEFPILPVDESAIYTCSTRTCDLKANKATQKGQRRPICRSKGITRLCNA